MINSITKIDSLETKHLDTIIHFYPNFEKEKIRDIKIDNGIITFRYNGNTFVCYHRFKNKNNVCFNSSSFNFPYEFVISFFKHFLNNTKTSQTNVNNELLQKMLNIIGEYYTGLDFSKVTDVKILKGHILFRYNGGIYICPIKHMHEYKSGINLKKEVKKISDVIVDHFPQINTQEIDDLEIEENMIIFSFRGEKYLCPLDTFAEIKAKTKEAKIKEDKFLELEKGVKKAVLRVIK